MIKNLLAENFIIRNNITLDIFRVRVGSNILIIIVQSRKCPQSVPNFHVVR